MNIWDEIKNRFSCRDIADEYGVNLSKKKAVCPFCTYKKNPAFYITDDYFICHHCQKKGDLFNLIGEFEKTDRWGALKILGVRAGIKFTPSKQDEQKEDVSRILKLFCEHFLIGEENSPPWKYLIDRGLTPDVWEKLKFSPIIIHLHCNTSKGKTTVLRMVSSIFGNPDFGKGVITWDVTEKYIIRYLEHLRNVPLCIDELTAKNMKNFQSVIYSISGGVSRGKASSIDPFDIVELRNSSTLIFSNGEPPMLAQNSFAGETVRVWDPMAWGTYLLRSSFGLVLIGYMCWRGATLLGLK